MTTYKTKTGRTLTDDDLDTIADEVESAHYDVEELKPRRRARPAMGSGPADVVPVRIDPELKDGVRPGSHRPSGSAGRPRRRRHQGRRRGCPGRRRARRAGRPRRARQRAPDVEVDPSTGVTDGVSPAYPRAGKMSQAEIASETVTGGHHMRRAGQTHGFEQEPPGGFPPHRTPKHYFDPAAGEAEPHARTGYSGWTVVTDGDGEPEDPPPARSSGEAEEGSDGEGEGEPESPPAGAASAPASALTPTPAPPTGVSQPDDPNTSFVDRAKVDALAEELGATRAPIGGRIDPSDMDLIETGPIDQARVARASDLAQPVPDEPEAVGDEPEDDASSSSGRFGAGAIDPGPEAETVVSTAGPRLDVGVPDLDALRDGEGATVDAFEEALELVGLGNSVVPGQAAILYSLMRPSHRLVRSAVTVAGGVSGGSSTGVGGRCRRERWGRWPL